MKINMVIMWDGKKENVEFNNIDPASISIAYGFISFGEKAPSQKHWTYNLNSIIEMNVEEEK